MDRIKVLIISTSGFLKKEGISTVIYDYYSRIDQEVIEPHIGIWEEFDHEYVSKFEKSGFVVNILPSRKKNIFKYFVELEMLMKKEKFSAIHVNGSSAIMSVELLAAKLSGCKIRIVHSHNTDCIYKKADRILRPLFYRLYTDAFACGDEAGKWLYGNRKFKIIKNGRDIQKYSYSEIKRDEIRNKLNLNENFLAVGHVGNFTEQKNHRFALYVFKELHKINPNSKLFFMGTGKLFDEIKNLAVELGLEKSVVFTGSIANVDEMLQAMDVMLFPSIHEGLPLAVVEWQIAALPCLLSDKVTKECVFCDLVQFQSLSDDYKVWANELLRISSINRSYEAKNVIKAAYEYGYDINKNVVELQEFLCKGISE